MPANGRRDLIRRLKVNQRTCNSAPPYAVSSLFLSPVSLVSLHTSALRISATFMSFPRKLHARTVNRHVHRWVPCPQMSAIRFALFSVSTVLRHVARCTLCPCQQPNDLVLSNPQLSQTCGMSVHLQRYKYTSLLPMPKLHPFSSL